MKASLKERGKKKISSFAVSLVLLLAGALVLLYLAGGKLQQLEGQMGILIQETAHVEIEAVQIEEKLELISELATSTFEYTNKKTISNTRQLFGIDIPGTTNTVELAYTGVIKVGYDMSAISYRADEEKLQLIFTLPEAKVLDNYIILDTLQCNDKNNIFNPIGSAEIAEYFKQIQLEEEAAAIERGIFSQAEQQLKSIIINYFAVFDDYTVVFE